jgi:hypothetical protein
MLGPRMISNSLMVVSAEVFKESFFETGTWANEIKLSCRKIIKKAILLA